MSTEYTMQHPASGRVYCLLGNAARNRQTVTYSDVAEAMGVAAEWPHWGPVWDLADAINTFERAAGRPMLSALIVHQWHDHRPGRGFFRCAIRFGHDVALDDPVGMEVFWQDERDAVYKDWAA